MSPQEQGRSRRPQKVGAGPESSPSVADRRRGERRVLRSAFLLSVAIHLLVLLLWPSIRNELERQGGAALSDRIEAAASAGVMQALAPASAPPDARLPPPRITMSLDDLPEPIEFDPEATSEVDLEVPELPEPGRGATAGIGEADAGDTGAAGASGAGTAGDGTGAGAGVALPVPLRVVQPRHRDLSDRRVTIHVFVDTDGRVVPDSTRFEPPLSDESLAGHLQREAAGWIFRPARSGGEPVAAWWSFEVGG